MVNDQQKKDQYTMVGQQKIHKELLIRLTIHRSTLNSLPGLLIFALIAH